MSFVNRLLLPAALVLAGMASAQTPYVAVRTLLSPPLMGANRHFCTVTNVSAQAVPLIRLQLVTVGAVLASAPCAGPGQQLGPGQSCTLTSPEISTLGTPLPFSCRAQHTGPEKAVVGVIQSFFVQDGDTRPTGAMPMTLATGIALAP